MAFEMANETIAWSSKLSKILTFCEHFPLSSVPKLKVLGNSSHFLVVILDGTLSRYTAS